MNLDERSFEADSGTKPMATYQNTMQERDGDLAATFLKLYPNSTQEQSGSSQKAALRDSGLVAMFMWAQLREKTARNQAFTYYWTHPMPGPDRARFGAFHTSEVPYVLKTLDQANRPWTDQDRKLADLLGSYWINFMKSGNPNGRGLPAWPASSSTSPVTMELGENTRPHPVVDKTRREFWEKYFTRPKGPTSVICVESAASLDPHGNGGTSSSSRDSATARIRGASGKVRSPA